MVSTAVLARLLAPEDYGLVGMTTVVVGFIQLFKDVGLSEATIQRAEINHKQISTLFWINCALGLGVCLLIIFLSPVAAWFYGEPRVIGIMLALSINFLIGGLGVQHQALLKRQMQFTALARISITSMAIGVTVAVTAGFLNAGYWALVLLPITSSISDTFLFWSACRWRPGMPDFRSGISDMLKFGGNITGFQTVNYFTRNLDNILIGRVWGAQALGLYAKAYQLLLLPITQINAPITSVAMPALSRLQDNPEQYKRYYFKALSLITSIGMPIVCFLLAAADQVVLLMLGEKWLDAVPIFRLLAPAALVGTFNVAAGWAYQSLGRTDKQFQAGIITSLINSCIFVFSVHWGIVVLAAAFGFSRPIMSLFIIGYCYRGTFLKAIDFWNSIYRQLISSSLSCVMTWCFLEFVAKNWNPFVSILLGLALFSLLYFLFWGLMPDGRRNLKETFSTLKSLRKKTSGS